MKNYKPVFTYLLFILLLAVPPLVLGYTGYESYLVPHFWLLFAYVSSLTFFVVTFVVLVQQKNMAAGGQAFLGATVFKLLACLVFMLIFLRKVNVDRVIFLGNFAYIYFLNTAFEIYGLLRNLRNQNLK